MEKSGTPVVSSIMLGNGDIMLPMTLAVGSYILFGNAFLSLMIICGAGTGLIFTVSLLRKYKVGLPAIPPLFAFISIFLAIAFLLSNPANINSAEITGGAALISLLVMYVTLRKVGRNKFE